jgi:hypothetical protein
MPPGVHISIPQKEIRTAKTGTMATALCGTVTKRAKGVEMPSAGADEHVFDTADDNIVVEIFLWLLTSKRGRTWNAANLATTCKRMYSVWMRSPYIWACIDVGVGLRGAVLPFNIAKMAGPLSWCRVLDTNLRGNSSYATTTALLDAMPNLTQLAVHTRAYTPPEGGLDTVVEWMTRSRALTSFTLATHREGSISDMLCQLRVPPSLRTLNIDINTDISPMFRDAGPFPTVESLSIRCDAMSLAAIALFPAITTLDLTVNNAHSGGPGDPHPGMSWAWETCVRLVHISLELPEWAIDAAELSTSACFPNIETFSLSSPILRVVCEVGRLATFSRCEHLRRVDTHLHHKRDARCNRLFHVGVRFSSDAAVTAFGASGVDPGSLELVFDAAVTPLGVAGLGQAVLYRVGILAVTVSEHQLASVIEIVRNCQGLSRLDVTCSAAVAAQLPSDLPACIAVHTHIL